MKELDSVVFIVFSLIIWLSMSTVCDVIVNYISSEKLNKAIHKDNMFLYELCKFAFYFPIGTMYLVIISKLL